ncbi:MAG: HAMP domain-containing protein [Candidatus Schekmanbacteria bacterium]|nr:HAMP domain-containing protein [Candidatus Schekmanbacteria bacterium]
MPDQEQEQRRRKHKRLIVLGMILLLVVLTATELLIQGLGSPDDIQENIKLFLILNINIIISLALIATVFRHLVKLYLERRQKVLGSKFKSKLIFFFVILALIPTTLLFLVSNNLINSTIDNWFNDQNEDALKKSLQVAQTYYQQSLGKALQSVQEAAKIISRQHLLEEASYYQINKILLQKQKQGQIGIIKIYNVKRTEVFVVPKPRDYKGYFVSDNNSLLERGFKGELFSLVRDQVNIKGDLIDAVVPVFSAENPEAVSGVILFNYYAPQGMMSLINDIKKSYEDYKTRRIYRTPLKSIYSLIVLVSTLMVILAAVWIAFHIARGITIPFQSLAEGTREIAAGNLDFRVAVKGDDEINILVNSFNKMTADLKQNKLALENSNQELERRKNYTETILENITSGVLSFDGQGRLSTFNRSAGQMLHLSREKIGQTYQDIFQKSEFIPVRDFIQQGFTRRKNKWRSELQLHLADETLHLLASAAVLKKEEGIYPGLVVVFDDITQLMKAQKMAAWQEVARRIAHEIKNPLTPIQLCTQRLRKKFAQKSSDYEQVFNECTQTVIREVEVIKRMVDEFSRFARLPSTNLQPALLNEVVQQTVSLYSSIPNGIKIIVESTAEIPQMMLDDELIKQMLVNLIDNAIHASDRNQNIRLKTSCDLQLRVACLEIIDEGTGIAPDDKDKLFLPYFSKKKGGTGLGLSIVNRIVTEHNGTIRVEDNQPKGARFIVELPLAA